MKSFIRIFKFTLPVLLVTVVCLLFATKGDFTPVLQAAPDEGVAHTKERKKERKNGSTLMKTVATMTSSVSCTPWQDLSLGTGSGSSTYDTCEPDTVVLSTNAVTTTNATADNQELVYQELCGTGELIAKVSSLSGGYAGLFVRESDASGSRKCALLTQLGTQVFRQLRSTTNFPQFQAAFAASGNQWLKITRTSTHVLGYWSTNGSSWNLSFFTPLSMTDCVLIGMTAHSTNSSITIDATFTDITVVQTETNPATEVSFADSSLTALAGDTVQICVNLENPCYCSPVTVDVALTSDSLPHLIGYETQTLTFSEGDTVQCFSIVLEQSDSNQTYSFELTNLSGGYESEVGTIATLNLEVEGYEEAEPTFGACGSFYKAPPIVTDSSELLYGDRFGNLYLREELELPAPIQSFEPPAVCGCDDFNNTEVPWQNENYFELYFTDCLSPASPPIGFADPIIGEDRRRVACKAFAYLSHLVQRPSNPCDEEQVLPKINIEVNSYVDANDGKLASASPYYEVFYHYINGGIIDALPWKIINNPGYTSQLDPAAVGMKHGKLDVNLAFNYYLDDNEPVPIDLFDLYTLLLHEGLHIMGFHSAMQILNGSYFMFGPNNNIPLKSYSRFDTHLALEDATQVITRDNADPYKWILNPLIDVNTDLHASCTTTPGPRMDFVSADNQSKFPIYTGSYPVSGMPNPNEDASTGSSFSHLNRDCPNTPEYYLMEPFMPTGERLDLIEDGERRILCELGYQVLNMTDCSCSVAGNFDPVKACSGDLFEFMLCEDSPEFIIDLEDILGNDIGADGVAYLVPFDHSDEIVDNLDGTLTLTVCAPGLHSFLYTPTSSVCPQEGNPVIVDILVERCEDCGFFSSEDEVPNANPCNLICNPHVVAYGDGEPIGLEDIISIECNEGSCFDFPGWFMATLTPDFYGTESVFSNSGALRMRIVENGQNESTYTPLILDGGKYFFSYYSMGRNWVPSGSQQFVFEMNAMLVDPNITTQFGNCYSNPSYISEVDLEQGNSQLLSSTAFSGPSTTFKRDVKCMNVPLDNDFTALWFWSEVSGTGSAIKEILLDEVEVVEDDFNAGDDQDFNCLPLSLGGLDYCMLSDIEVRYTWKDEADNSLLEYTVLHNHNGTTSVDGSVVDPVVIPALTISPTQTTTYTLMREVVTSGFEDFAACFDDEDEVVVNFVSGPPMAVLSLVSEDCGLVTFSISGLQAGDTWEINYGDGTSGTSLQHNYSLTETSYTATLTVSNPCGTLQSMVGVTVDDCESLLCCPNTGSTLLVNTTISDAIAQGLPSGGTSQDLCIEGVLTIDQDYEFTGNLFMAPDASIVVTSQATLELDGAHLQGCEFLWNGIIVSQPHFNGDLSLISHNETIIEDAKRGIAASNKVFLDIKKTTFDQNYIGMDLRNVSISGFYGNTFDCSAALLPPLTPTGQIGTYSYAGIKSQTGTLHIGVAGAIMNTFKNVRNGILNHRGTLTVDNTVFYDIAEAPGEPYDLTGFGIHHRGSRYAPLLQYGLQNNTVPIPSFDNCHTAIWANRCNVKVHDNAMVDVQVGVHIERSPNANLRISRNEIESYGQGISLTQNDPANFIEVADNTIDIIQGTSSIEAIVGILIEENGAEQQNATIRQNTISLDKGAHGIRINTANNYTTYENEVLLISTTANDVTGIELDNSINCRVSCNEVTGSGKGSGIVSHYTSSTLFTCNTVENLTTGTAFDGASSENELKNTYFQPPFSQGLLYKQNIVMMPIQSHRGNQWGLGTYGIAGAVHLGSGNLSYFTSQRFEIHTTSFPYYPSVSLPNSSGVPGTAWFALADGSPVTCDPNNECSVLGFIPDKEDIKPLEEQLAEDQFSSTWQGGLHWAAQYQLYEMLERSPGIRDTSTVMASFYSNKGTAVLGRLYELKKDIDTLFLLLPEKRDSLQQHLQQTDSLMEALILADSILVNDPPSASPGLSRQLLIQCDSLTILSENLVNTLAEARIALIDTINVQNTSIPDTAIYQSNEKMVNRIYLATVLLDSIPIDSLQADTIYGIATQCPEIGGPAVYRARSLYALFSLVDFDTISCQSIALSQSPPANQPDWVSISDKKPVRFHVFPNPNNGNFTVTYKLEHNGTLILTDLLGRTVKTITLFADIRKVEVLASELKAGLYYLQIVSDQNKSLHTERVIIH